MSALQGLLTPQLMASNSLLALSKASLLALSKANIAAFTLLDSAMEISKETFIREVEGGESCRTQNALWIYIPGWETELLPRSDPRTGLLCERGRQQRFCSALLLWASA